MSLRGDQIFGSVKNFTLRSESVCLAVSVAVAVAVWRLVTDDLPCRSSKPLLIQSHCRFRVLGNIPLGPDDCVGKCVALVLLLLLLSSECELLADDPSLTHYLLGPAGEDRVYLESKGENQGGADAARVFQKALEEYTDLVKWRLTIGAKTYSSVRRKRRLIPRSESNA